MSVIRITADGSCINNPGPGAWAIVCHQPDGTLQRDRCGKTHTTNNEMEISGLLAALLLAEELHPRNPGATFLICSDSQHALTGYAEWIDNWRQKNWRGSRGPVSNRHVWEQVAAAKDRIGHLVATQWVKGHGSDRENIMCDEIANTFAHAIKDGAVVPADRFGMPSETGCPFDEPAPQSLPQPELDLQPINRALEEFQRAYTALVGMVETAGLPRSFVTPHVAKMMTALA